LPHATMHCRGINGSGKIRLRENLEKGHGLIGQNSRSGTSRGLGGYVLRLAKERVLDFEAKVKKDVS